MDARRLLTPAVSLHKDIGWKRVVNEVSKHFFFSSLRAFEIRALVRDSVGYRPAGVYGFRGVP